MIRQNIMIITLLSGMKTRFGTGTFEKVRLWCDINYKIRINILQRNYLIECWRNDVLPKKIFNLNSKFNEFSFHSNFCERKFQHSLNKFKCSLLNLQIKNISNHINFLKNSFYNKERIGEVFATGNNYRSFKTSNCPE